MKKKDVKRGELVYLELMDLTTKDERWQPFDEAAKEVVVKVVMVGFYVGETPETLTVTSMFIPEDGHVGPVTIIPKGSILKRSVLR